jgi:hypothetical protein
VGRSLSVSGVFRIEFSEVEWPEPDGFKFTILTGKSLELRMIGTMPTRQEGPKAWGNPVEFVAAKMDHYFSRYECQMSLKYYFCPKNPQVEL